MTQKSSPPRKWCRFTIDLHMCTIMQNHCIMCTHGIRKMVNTFEGFKKWQKGCHARKYYPLEEKTPPGCQSDSKMMPPNLREKYRFRVDLRRCTMMQNHCNICTHGIPKMEKMQEVQKIEKWLPWTEILSLG